MFGIIPNPRTLNSSRLLHANQEKIGAEKPGLPWFVSTVPSCERLSKGVGLLLSTQGILQIFQHVIGIPLTDYAGNIFAKLNGIVGIVAVFRRCTRWENDGLSGRKEIVANGGKCLSGGPCATTRQNTYMMTRKRIFGVQGLGFRIAGLGFRIDIQFLWT